MPEKQQETTKDPYTDYSGIDPRTGREYLITVWDDGKTAEVRYRADRHQIWLPPIKCQLVTG